MTPVSAPDAPLAADIAAKTVGVRPTRVSRFPTGLMHYVFDVGFEDGSAVVVRIAAEHGRAAMAGASLLSRKLRPMSVPLPRILAQDFRGEHPYIVMERLEGRDLGYVIDRLSDTATDAIAARVSGAQAIVARLPRGDRFGYAVTADQAPHAAWSDVLVAHAERSKQRILDAGVFGIQGIADIDRRIAALRQDLDLIPATPFLHDTTTKNVIVAADGTFSGIVDVDDLCFGDPRYAVALTHASLLSSGASLRYTESWMRIAGFRDDLLFRLYVVLFLLDFLSEHGQAFNDNRMPSSKEEREKLFALYTRSLKEF